MEKRFSRSEGLKRSWVEIELPLITGNISSFMKELSLANQIMAVVKADAYGHGDRIVAKYLTNNGIRHFAVSNVDEAVHIREAGVEGQVLILGYTPIERTQELINYDITQALLSEDYANRLAATNLPVKCQFALDTGMRRIGLNTDDPAECERIVRKTYSTCLQLDGLFTHLCVADTQGSRILKFAI
jgi:alanine racemase